MAGVNARSVGPFGKIVRWRAHGGRRGATATGAGAAWDTRLEGRGATGRLACVRRGNGSSGWEAAMSALSRRAGRDKLTF